MREFAVYTLSRLGLFVASYVLVIAAFALVSDGSGLLVLWPILAALVLSSIASIFLLRGQRDRFASVVERRATEASQRYDDARTKEDDPEG